MMESLARAMDMPRQRLGTPDASGDVWPVGGRAARDEVLTAFVLTEGYDHPAAWYASVRALSSGTTRYTFARGLHVDVERRDGRIRRIEYGDVTETLEGDRLEIVDEGQRSSYRVSRKAPTDKGLSQPLPVPFDVGIPGEERLPLDGDEAFEVWLNGKGPFRFALDSGAVDLLKSTVAAKLGLAIEGSRSARGVTNQTVTSGYVNVDRVAVGSAIESHRPFLVLDLPAPVDGLLGFETLRRLPVTLDYAARTLTVTPSTAEPKACDVVVPFAFDGRTPLVDGSLNTVPAQFWIDSGNDDSAIVFDRFNAGHPGALSQTGTSAAGQAVGGAESFHVLQPVTVTLGSLAFPNLAAKLLLGQSNGAIDANLGYDLLRRYPVSFDYANRRLIFHRTC